MPEARPSRRIPFHAYIGEGDADVGDDEDLVRVLRRAGPDSADSLAHTQGEYPIVAGSKKVLCVAEKPSIAQTLADALSNEPVHTRKGIATPVHGGGFRGASRIADRAALKVPSEFHGRFRGHPAAFKVTSVTGHGAGPSLMRTGRPR